MNAFRREKTIISLIKSCTLKSHLFQLHSLLIRSSLFYNPTVFLAFLSRLTLPSFRDLPYCHRIFSDFPHPNVSLYIAMIKLHSSNRDSARNGFQLYWDSIRSGISPNALSATVALKCCTKMESLSSGLQIHAKIWREGFLSDGILLTTLMDFYSYLGEGSDACKVFDELSHKDTIAWNVLISCFLRNGRTRDVLGLFNMMRNSKDCQPDDVTCLHLLQACGSLNALKWGQKLHNYIVKHNLLNAKNVCNSLIAMYSRCGCVEKAYEIFNQMSDSDRDVVSWSAMISGLASHGYGRDAIKAFKQMRREGISPDDQTFTGVLSACSHSGLVNEGCMFFKAMIYDYGVKPNVHHYGCMVDLLGRAGLLDDAYELMISMRVKPDAAMWRTLLGACRIHRNVSLGEQVIDHLVELKAQEAGDYILLMNIYSSIGNREKVIEVRKMMRDKGIQVSPASSSMVLKGKVHVFSADDTSHPRKKEIYEMLGEINQQLRIGGYVAETTCEQQTFSYHSEKLAIAFGVVGTPPGTTIRVAKDVRICRDCHNFCKMFSAVYNRKVIVRDEDRFHHFQEGCCSCKDCW